MIFLPFYLFISLHFIQISSFPSLEKDKSSPVPRYPLQLTANIEIIAHLISDDTEYPPRRRYMRVYYDYINKLARADIKAGYEAEKQYYRYYNNTKREYMIRSPPINDCQRAYLGEKMPFPDIPDAQYVETKVQNNILCNYFLHSDYDTRVHIYLAAGTGEPVQLTVSSIKSNPDGTEIMTDLLTYLYSDVVLGPPPSSVFDLPEPYASSAQTSCERQVGGFPYLHAFHYFVRF